VLNELIHPR